MLGILVAAAMALSFFLPWVEFLGDSAGPSMILQENVDWARMPWQLWAFLASFVLAALGAVLALVRRPAGGVMLVAGAIPFGLVAQAALSAQGQLDDLGLPRGLVNVGDLQGALEALDRFAGIGLYVYWISAALLIVIGIARAVRGA